MARKYTEYRCTCEVCGEPFYSKRIGSRYDTEACKMKAYRARKIQQALEKKFQLDMETYSLFQQIVDRSPPLLPYLTDFLRSHDQDTFKQVLQIVTITQTGVTAAPFIP